MAYEKIKVSADGQEAIFHCPLRKREHGCHGLFAVNLQNPSTIRVIRQHSRHDKDSDFLEAEKAKQELRELASTRPTVRPREIIDQVRRNLSATSADMLGSYNSMRQVVSRARPVDVEKERTNAQDPQFVGWFSLTLDNRRFLLYDMKTQPHQKRIVIFASKECLEILSRSSVVMVDGTFDSIADPFMQLVTLHCEVFKGVMKPVVFILLESKETSQYHTSFQSVKQHRLLINWRPRIIIVGRLRNVVAKRTQTDVPCSTCLGLLFPFGHGEEGQSYCEFITTSYQATYCVNLATPKVFAILFFTYIQNNCIGCGLRTARFPIETWNCHRRTAAGIPRTTNAAESFHKLLSVISYRTFGLRKVNMSDLMDCIRKEKEHTLMDVAVITINPRAQIQAKRKQCMIEKDASLRNIVRNQAMSSPQLNGLNYLKAIVACLRKHQ